MKRSFIMIKPLKISVAEMVKAAKTNISEVTAKQALELYQDENIVIVDIRDIRERQKLGFIPGSYHAHGNMNFGSIRKARMLRTFGQISVLFYCVSGCGRH